MTFFELFPNFFKHKDFLPSADKIPGTMFTPLHFIWAALLAVGLILLVVFLRKMKEKNLKILFTALWALLVVLEVIKITWETTSGKTVNFEWYGMLPLYPCSVFMYAMPFAIWGKGILKRAACGYVCTLGLIGGLINFVYPATILGNYSCISFAGFHTFTYHGVLVLTACLMLVTGYHSYRATKWYDLFLPALPLIAVSIAANIVNFTLPNGADYMFFRCTSFIFAPIGEALGLWSVPLMYIAYIIAHGIFYVPGLIVHLVKKKKA